MTQTPKIVAESLKILIGNGRTFLSIFALTTLPLSLLLVFLSLLSAPLRSRVAHLESLARAASTRFEARQVWRESREDAVSFFYARSLFLLPALFLSLAASVSAVNSVALAAAGKIPTLRSAVAAVKLAWKRPLVTSILVHAILLTYSFAVRTLAAGGGGELVLLVGFACQNYLLAVMNLAIVVSIAEEKFGVDAIRAGSGLMEGKRICAWFLSGLFVLARGWIAEALDNPAAAFDERYRPGIFAPTAVSRVAAEIVDKIGFVVLYGLVILFSYVVFSVLYLECCRSSKKRHENRAETEIVSVLV